MAKKGTTFLEEEIQTIKIEKGIQPSQIPYKCK